MGSIGHMKVSSTALSATRARFETPSVPGPDRVAQAHTALEIEFARRCPNSVLLHERAQRVMPGGVSHDNRRVGGPSLFISKARGARKTDKDGHNYIDYWIGHGSLLLGHGRREIIEAIHLAAQDCTHPGACHEREVLWAEKVKALIPSADRVRFTASGSESSALAVRLARAMTKKNVIVKFDGHFHGWLDHAVQAVDLPFDLPFSAGVPQQVRDLTLTLPARNLEAVDELLNSRDDIAAIILEPTGASGGSIPIRPDFLRGLRDLTIRHRVALIFDEVITGFRIAPGGAQQRYNILPDITCLAKVLAGGMPGGAVCGSHEAFAAMEFSGDSKKDRLRRVTQYGTYNASPVSAAAGTAMLGMINDDVCKRAEANAGRLRHGLNTLFEKEGLPWAAYGISSVFHILTSDACVGTSLRDGTLDAADADPVVLKQKGPLDGLLRRALQLDGVDLPPGRQAWVSTAHTNGEIEETLAAFSRAISRLRTLNVL